MIDNVMPHLKHHIILLETFPSDSAGFVKVPDPEKEANEENNVWDKDVL